MLEVGRTCIFSWNPVACRENFRTNVPTVTFFMYIFCPARDFFRLVWTYLCNINIGGLVRTDQSIRREHIVIYYLTNHRGDIHIRNKSYVKSIIVTNVTYFVVSKNYKRIRNNCWELTSSYPYIQNYLKLSCK